MNVQNNVCKLFNKHFAKAASSIGQPDTLLEGYTLEDVLGKQIGHSSVKFIRDELRRENVLNCDM